MSLDVYLVEKEDVCACCGRGREEETVFEANITHNLNSMADAAGIYQCLWTPEQNNFKQAKDISLALKIGIAEMERDPERFKTFSANNGWGTYEQFIPWLKKYLAACEEYPEAYIRASG